MGHQGQDIRPPTNAAATYWVLAATGGVIDAVGGSSGQVNFARGNLRYINLHTSDIQVTNGTTVQIGQRLAKVNEIAPGGTTIHLHFEITDNGVDRSPYRSLVDSYQEAWIVKKELWDNNHAMGCRYGAFWDFDTANTTLADRTNSICGSSLFRANGYTQEADTGYQCLNSAGFNCERVYLDAICGTPNTGTSSFDPSLTRNWVGDGQTNLADRVFQLQYDLYREGFNPSTNLDCNWGQVTKTAVIDFQLCNNLGSGGTMGTFGWGVLVDENLTASECSV